jgi:hypothetical protein
MSAMGIVSRFIMACDPLAKHVSSCPALETAPGS